MLCDSHLQVVEPRLHIRAKTLLCVSPVGRLSTVPLHRRVPPGGGPLTLGGRSVTCTAFPYVTLHSQPFPITRLVAALCYTCYFLPLKGLRPLSICLHSCDAP